MYEGDIVRQSGEVRDQVADPLARLASLPERVLRLCQIACGSLECHGRPAGKRLVVPLDEFRFVVPRFELTDRSRAEDDDDSFGFCRKVCWPRSIRTGRIDLRLWRGEQSVIVQQAGEPDRAKSARGRKEASAVE